MFALLRQPHLRRFFLAHGQSQLGTGAGYVALVLIAYQRLHSSWAVALVLLADFLPAIGLSAWFGVLADRHSRAKLAIAAELLRAGAFGALALSGSLATTVAFALVAGVGTALFRPAVGAALPQLVTAGERTQATALYGALQNAGFTLGPALCGLFLLFGPVAWVLAANAASFVVSAGLLARVPLGCAPRTPRPADHHEQPASAWQDAKEGARYAARRPGVASLLAIGALSMLCGATINVAEPLLAIGPLHAGSSGFSVLVTLYGIGMVAGAAYTARLGSRLSTLRVNFLGGVGVSGIAMLGCGLAGGLTTALGPFALGGFANAMIVNPQNRLVQELVPEMLCGRVFGLQDALESACFAVAFVAAGALGSVIGPRPLYLLSGVLLTATACLGVVLFRIPAQARIPTDAAVHRPGMLGPETA